MYTLLFFIAIVLIVITLIEGPIKPNTPPPVVSVDKPKPLPNKIDDNPYPEEIDKPIKEKESKYVMDYLLRKNHERTKDDGSPPSRN